MQEPFPALENLALHWKEERPRACFPSGFLGGSAPRLQYLHLEGIIFPALPTLLSSTRNLVDLRLHYIPKDGLISPEAMVACLATLPKLNFLQIGFQPTSHLDQIPLPPLTQTLLPSLTAFEFYGDSMYLEECVSRIDSPQLNQIYVSYSNEFLDLRIAQLFKFIDRSEALEKTLLTRADVDFLHRGVAFEMYSCPERRPSWCRIGASASIYRLAFERQILDIAEVFSQPSKILSQVIHLKLSRYEAIADRLGDEWLFLLCKFSAVRTLHLSQTFARQVAISLDDITGEMVAKVLPVLDFIFLDGQPVSCIEKFLAARQLAGLPVVIVDTEVEFDERVKSY